jgi:hypothetical protein
LEFSTNAQFEDDRAVVRLEDDLPFPRFAHGPPPLHPKLPKRLKSRNWPIRATSLHWVVGATVLAI